MRRYLVGLLLLCIIAPKVVGMSEQTVVERTVIAQGGTIPATQWFVLANCASFCAHALIENTYKAAGVSFGIVGALYLWEYLINEKACNRSHAKNLLAILLGGGQGGFCGYWARSSVFSKLWPAAFVSVPAAGVTLANQGAPVSQAVSSVGNSLPVSVVGPLVGSPIEAQKV